MIFRIFAAERVAQQGLPLPSVLHKQIKDMVNYGLKDRVALITGANNPQGIGATTAFAFAREGAKVVLVYKRIPKSFINVKQSLQQKARSL